MYVANGQTVLLKCSAFGNPSPEIIWTKGAKSLESGADINIGVSQLQHGVSSELSIIMASKENEGDYTVNASNEHGTCIKKIQLSSKHI